MRFLILIVLILIGIAQVMSLDLANEVGKVSKQWSGFVKEIYTNADNFGVSCK